MVKEKELLEALKRNEVKAQKVPVLYWNKKATQKEKEDFADLVSNDRINIFYNMERGVIGYKIEEILNEEELGRGCYEIKKSNRDENRYVFQYLPEVEMLHISEWKINARAIKKKDIGEIRNWEKVNEFFTTKNKLFIYKNTYYDWAIRQCYCDKHFREYSSAPGFIPMMSNLPRTDCGINGETFEEMAVVFTKIYPQFCNVGGNRVVDIVHQKWGFDEFMKYREPMLGTGPKQKRINELTSIPLPKPNFGNCKDERADFNSYYRNLEKLAIINKVDDELCVLRTFSRYEDVYQEGARIYVGKKEVISCRPRNDGKWVNMVLNSTGSHWDFKLIEFDPEITKGTKLEYFTSIINDVPEQLQGKYIWAMLNLPIIEQLSKIGFKNIMIPILENLNWQRAKGSVEDIFGALDTKKKSLNDQLGINKYQMKKLLEFYEDYSKEELENKYHRDIPAILIHIKNIFSEEFCSRSYSYYDSVGSFESISFLDNKTFDKLFDAIKKIIEKASGKNYYYRNIINNFVKICGKLRSIYSQQTMLNNLDNLIYISDKKISSTAYNHWRGEYKVEYDAFHLYNDYLDMVVKLDDTAHFKAGFDVSDLTTIRDMHDAVVSVYNLKKDEMMAKEFGKISDRWNKWLYENDDYAIIAPKFPNDIAQEGIELHHCVKSYIDRVMAKTTNILFLRKKEDINTPFFTIEVTNDGAIQQIHGFGNRNLSTEPDAVPFVYEWIKARKMKESNFNKVR